MKLALLLLVLACGLPYLAAAAPEGFDRYKVILDRKPFGEPPIAPEPAPTPAPQAPPWADSYRLVSVTKVEGDEVRVGLLDTKSNKAVVLKVGEQDNGIELLSADVGEESAELRKGGEVVTMNLKSASGGSRPPAAAKPQEQASNRPRTAAPRTRPPQPPANVNNNANRSARGVVRNRPPRPPGR